MKQYYDRRAPEYDDWYLGQGAEWQRLALHDGTSWRVYKRYFSVDGLAAELSGGEALANGHWFVAVRA